MSNVVMTMLYVLVAIFVLLGAFALYAIFFNDLIRCPFCGDVSGDSMEYHHHIQMCPMRPQ